MSWLLGWAGMKERTPWSDRAALVASALLLTGIILALGIFADVGGGTLLRWIAAGATYVGLLLLFWRASHRIEVWHCGEAWRDIAGPRAPGTKKQAVDVEREPVVHREMGVGTFTPPALLSGRFLHRGRELDNLSALFRGKPLHFFPEVVWYVELNHFCHSPPAFSSDIPTCALLSRAPLSIVMPLPLPSALTAHEIAQTELFQESLTNCA